MKLKIKNFIGSYRYEIILILIMSILALMNLDRIYFASDEGYNVTMGQYILRNNFMPKVWDGKNIITTINGNDFNSKFVCINLNWGAYYITALAQWIFGKNHIAIRYVFVIIGIISSIFWYQYVYFTTNKVIARIFHGIYCLSIPIIIYIKAANYYAPSLLFIALMHLLYKKGLKTDKKSHWVIFIVSSIIQFHINYMLYVLTIFPILLDFILNRIYKKKFIISTMVINVFTIPFFIWMRYNFKILGSNYRNIVFVNFKLGYIRFIEQFWHLSYYIMPIIPLAAIYIIIKRIYKKKTKINTDNLKIKRADPLSKTVRLSVITFLTSLIFLCYFTYTFETRYYLAAIPFMYLLGSILIYKIFTKDKITAGIIFALLLFTNTIHILPFNIISTLQVDLMDSNLKYVITSPVPPAWDPDINRTIKELGFQSNFFEYCKNINTPVNDEVKVLVNYLRENAKDGDTFSTYETAVWTNSIQYYTDLKLVNSLRKNYDSWAKDKQYINAAIYEHLVFCPDEYVDWIAFPELSELRLKMNADLYKQYDNNQSFKKIILEYDPNVVTYDIWLHSFKPTDNKKSLVVFQRIN